MFRNGLNVACSAYKSRLEARPLQTKMMTSALLFSVGDVLCQKGEATLCRPCKEKAAQASTSAAAADRQTDTRNVGSLTKQDWWDTNRTLRQSFIGGLLLSPGLHFFITRVMSRAHFPSLSRQANIGARVAIHQACMMPFIQFTVLFVSAALQNNGSVEERVEAGKQRFRDKWVTGFSASLMFWPAVNTVMYTKVQPRFMNLYADMASLFFATLMSYIIYKDCATSPALQEQQARHEVATGPSLALTSAATIFREAAQTVPHVLQTHLLSLMLDGSRVEAQSARRDDLPWLLSTTT